MKESPTPVVKQRWEAPRVETLPRLTDLTLQTAVPPDSTFSVNYAG
ncbi:MAG TPA: hypothetical protein VF625_18270 [Longimicrobium sp.]|jgi:hypothetical protein